ncbi:TnsA endonuclease N-terminal domain-containing protein [Cohnella cholangitidis]|uniref:S-layer protein n=1 Tax=Cohnella cholangitidis TaxID=2598458 RepID=A0A7G5C694_9BACL|nr:TnsA endonuclease N-terminal domain-containing protein [Cohnella cholangitidis]QMV44728.1 S-layer protein [Cohnella cholangitidis]
MYTPITIGRNMKYGSNYWTGLSSKINRKVQFYSDLEYDHWVHVETNPKVKSFCEQPLKIRHSMNGEVVDSIFDMWILFTDGTELFVEVKYQSELQPGNPKYERTIRQTSAQEEWCRSNNKKYQIKTDATIRSNSLYLSNLKQIISYTRNRIAPIEMDKHRIMNCIEDKKMSLRDIESTLYSLSPQRIRESICILIYLGYFNANIDSCVIGPSLEVWRNAQTKNN